MRFTKETIERIEADRRNASAWQSASQRGYAKFVFDRKGYTYYCEDHSLASIYSLIRRIDRKIAAEKLKIVAEKSAATVEADAAAAAGY